MDVVAITRDVAVAAPDIEGRIVAEIRMATAPGLRHGVYVVGVTRAGAPLTLRDDTAVQAGDVATLYGTSEDVGRVAAKVGTVIVPSDKTDFVYHGLGLVARLVIGLAVVRLGSIPLTLGSGGGVLLSGLAFGWYRSHKVAIGNLSTAASALLRDLGLAGFVAVVGLQSGLQAISTIRAIGLSIFLIGVVVTIVPLVITMLVGRDVLRYDNAAVLAGALSGSRSANPAFGEVLDKAGNAIPPPPSPSPTRWPISS